MSLLERKITCHLTLMCFLKLIFVLLCGVPFFKWIYIFSGITNIQIFGNKAALFSITSRIRDAPPLHLSPALLLQLTFNGIWFKSLWIIPEGFVVCRSLCHYGVFLFCVREYICVCVCVCVCWWGRGSKARRLLLLVWLKPPSFSLQRGCRRSQSEPIRPFGLHPQIPSSGQQRDYGKEETD